LYKSEVMTDVIEIATLRRFAAGVARPKHLSVVKDATLLAAESAS
jgi:hypothetical protein